MSPESKAVTITLGKSIGPRTARGRRRAKRIAEAKERSRENGEYFSPTLIRQPTKAEKIGKRSASPRYLLATITDLSFRPYTEDVSKDGCDAMYRAVNHAHQRDPRKKWS